MHTKTQAGGLARRLAVGMTLTAALAACSSPGGTAKHVTTARSHPATPSATASAAASPPAVAASALSGTWKGQYGGSYQGTFTLRWRQSGSNLSGTIAISNPATTLPIHGSVTGGAIRFGTVGSLAITYSGTVSGNSMSGTYQVHSGASSGGPWSAAKS
jgi:hypothetical protein